MSETHDLSTLKINFLTQSQYDGATINDDEVYILTDNGKGAQTAAPATTGYATANLKNIVLSSEDATNATDYPNGTVWMKYGSEMTLLDMFYPVGSYYETSDGNFNPNTSWGGTWELETAGQVHVSAGTGYSTGATGGATSVSYTPAGTVENTSVTPKGTVGNHTLTINEIPSHYHGFNAYNGGVGASSAIQRGWYGTTSETSVQNTNAKGGGGAHNHGFTGTAESHKHTFTGTQKSISVMQPYIVVNRWHRTA